MARNKSPKRKSPKRKSPIKRRKSRKSRKSRNSRNSRNSRKRRRSSTYISQRACSPLRKSTFRSGEFSTCYTMDALQKIRTAYNKTAPSNEKIPQRTSKKGLWNAIKDKVDNMNSKEGCEGEWCWVKQPFMKNINEKDLNSIKNLTFKPSIPKGKYDWLSTDDIDNVMKQYSKKYPDLYFMGTWPMDFEKLDKKFRNFDPKIIQAKGKKNVALVLNEDKSDEPGSHWVGLYMMLPSRQVHFFDSYGKKPLAPMCKWLTNINTKLKKNNEKPFTVLWNPHRHQYANSECGVYTLNFIVKRLEGNTFKSIVNNQIKDETMNKRRSTFFNPFDKYDNTIYGGGK